MSWLGVLIFCLGIFLNEGSYGGGNKYYVTPAQNPDFSQVVNGFQPKCDPDCKNSGICVAGNTCHCPANFHGTYCEFEKIPCLKFPPLPMNSHRKCSEDLCTITCMSGNKFADGTTIANMKCAEGQWVPSRANLSVIGDCQPECEPPCLNGGVCLSQNTCQCPAKYRGPQCQYSKCDPDCKNSGICVAGNTCHCPANFHGTYCEFEKIPCLKFPPLPMNSHRKCSEDLCTITCMSGNKFADGTTIANMKCAEGQWVPSRANLSVIGDCQPECEPPCLNGGVCLSQNTCQCPAKYRGPQCQYCKYQWVPSRANLSVIGDCQPECEPPCLNGGVCLSQNTCQCPAKYRGPQCQYCKYQWVPSRANLSVIGDCQPECEPPCLNGGVCLSQNTCQCPAKYRGPQQQGGVREQSQHLEDHKRTLPDLDI